jgi:dTMP kinase
MKNKPLFITFEGGEGVGKTTQIRMLQEYLEEQGIKSIATREPGGCESAETIRAMVCEGEDDKWDGISETLLYSVARHEHLRKVICPALENDKWVICDRFADSTTVYQGMGRGIPRENIIAIHKIAIGNAWPDLTIILDLDPEIGLSRTDDRLEGAHENRFESLDISFHHRVRDGFLRIAEENPDRCRTVNADICIDALHAKIVSIIEQFSTKNKVS